MKRLAWYGPFSGGTDIYLFQTADKAGKFYGYHFEVKLNGDEDEAVLLFFVKMDNSCNKKRYCFGSSADKGKVLSQLLPDPEQCKLT